MRQRFTVVFCALLLLGATAACGPKSDAALIRNFEHNQEPFEQMVQMVRAEDAAKIHVFATGSDANAVLSSDGLGVERAAQYRALVRKANVVDLVSKWTRRRLWRAGSISPSLWAPKVLSLHGWRAVSCHVGRDGRVSLFVDGGAPLRLPRAGDALVYLPGSGGLGENRGGSVSGTRQIRRVDGETCGACRGRGCTRCRLNLPDMSTRI